nr:endonuclease/exonuclease/phosphatase family protein [uncultured Celeribacter sp.]
MSLAVTLLGSAAQAEQQGIHPTGQLRVAVWTVELQRDGPGLLLRDSLRGDPQVQAARDHIRRVAPDVLLLVGFDSDDDGCTLAAFAQGLEYPFRFTRAGNSGQDTGRDLDKDGRLGEPEDAQSYGQFPGQGAMALLSRLPLLEQSLLDFSGLLWADFSRADLPRDYFDTGDLKVLRLSSRGHWDLAVEWEGLPLRIWAYAAGPPVFDGPEDRNGRRNADETRFWSAYLTGEAGLSERNAFVLLGNSNLDPLDGEGVHEVMRDLLADPRLQDPHPGSAFAREIANPSHHGPPAEDTADWPDPEPGNLRVDYVLPSADLTVLDSGVAWVPDQPGIVPFRHGLVWVDIARIP